MSAKTEMFQTNRGFIPKLTQDDYPTCRKKIHRVLVAMTEYNIVSGYELLPKGIGSAAHTLQMEWHQRANDAIALIHFGFTDNLLPCIDDIDNPGEIWQTLQCRLDIMTNQVSQAEIVRKLHALRQSKEEKITQYFTRQIYFCKKLSGSSETISDQTMTTNIFFTF
jgi:hypothetical protein